MLVAGGQPFAAAKGGSGGATASAVTPGAGTIQALSPADVPQVPGLDKFIRDSTAAQKLGKALFWDMQAGSDGRTACASCHFNSGADNRSRNQLNPRGGSFGIKGPNAQLDASDFPIHSEDVVGSQGVVPSAFNGVLDGDPFDGQSFAPTDKDFHVGSVNVRRTTGRNTPTAVNAVLNFREFWDGRAQNEFNGVNPFGTRDTGAKVGHVGSSGALEQVPISLTNSALASQAVGPPGNGVEMSSEGRTLADIGKKLLSVRPLASQQVSSSDSLLGDLSNGQGLKVNYADLIKQAFQPEWWDGGGNLTAANGNSYSLMQFNFPMYWGLAIQAYESTLLSDQTSFDKFQNGDASAMSSDAQTGMGIFNGKGNCASCHNGAAFTNATVAQVDQTGPTDGNHDTGFVNIGVRPSASDPGQAGSDPFGNPLSITGLNGGDTAAMGSTFKVPTLRNVELTAPYFHNGDQMTLRQVVDFYDRGGDVDNPEKAGEIRALGLSDTEKNQLVAFLESLTDQRVVAQSAPFDHPQLFVPAGEQTRADGSVVTDSDGHPVDCFKEVPATGSAGGGALARFPGFTGPPCDTPNALVRPSKSGPGGGSSAGGSNQGSTAPVTVIRRPAPGVLRLSIRTRMSLRDVLRNGLRFKATVPANARRVRARLYRLSGSKKIRVGLYVKRISRGGRVTIRWRNNQTRRLRAGRYLLRVESGTARTYLRGAADIRIRLVKVR